VVSDVAGAPFVILSMMDIFLLSLAELFVPSTLEMKEKLYNWHSVTLYNK
jgi:hypothetical protein